MHTKQERNLIRDTIKQCAGKKNNEVVEALRATGTKTVRGLEWDLKGLSNFKTRNKRLLSLRTKRRTKKTVTGKVKTYKVPHTRDTDALTLIELVIGANISSSKNIEVIERLVK